MGESRILSMPVLASSLQDVAYRIIQLGEERKSAFVCVANVHMIVTAKRNEWLRAAMENAYLVTSDGMPLVWELKRQGFTSADRVSGPDLMIEICRISQHRDLGIYFYGGSQAAAVAIREKLARQFSGLTICGVEAPPILPNFPEVDQAVIDRINSSGAGVVFVGLGCPKQELWMHAYSNHISAVLIGIGAAFDYFSGTTARAPRWMQNAGLEWLFRLCIEPKRLWKRYLFANSLYIYYLILELLLVKKNKSRP